MERGWHHCVLAGWVIIGAHQQPTTYYSSSRRSYSSPQTALDPRATPHLGLQCRVSPDPPREIPIATVRTQTDIPTPAALGDGEMARTWT